MSIKLPIGRWLALESLDDPLRHTQARLLQRFALVMLAALLSIPASLAAQSAVEPLTDVITALALLTCSHLSPRVALQTLCVRRPGCYGSVHSITER